MIKKQEKIHLFLTDKCNLNCPICYVDANSRFDSELTTQEWLSVIKEINSIDKNEIHVEGGEPFLREDLMEIILKFNDLSSVVISTNGTVTYDSKFKPLSSIKRLSFSIESHDSEKHSLIRLSSLEKVIQNMIEFKKNGFYVNTNTVLTKINYGDVLEIISFGVMYGIPMMRFAFCQDVGRAKHNRHLRLSEEDCALVLEQFYQAIERFGEKINLVLYLPEYTKKYIIEGKTEIKVSRELKQSAITADGSVYPCAALINSPEYRIGNIRNKRFLEILNDLRLQEHHPCLRDCCPKDNCSRITLYNSIFTYY